ncbi:MAG: hypothetical protein P8X55_07000 [Desulfosarcinaceae bacterium]
MVGKLTTVLIKKEAETYRAQGLHKEAIALYEKLVAGSPNIDPSLRSAIQNEVEGITREMHDFVASRDTPLSTEDILQIREGWGEEASPADIMICAQALYHIGAYKDALVEYQRLLQAGVDLRKIAGAIALCLSRAYPPPKFPRAVDALLVGVCMNQRQTLAFQLRLAENLAREKDKPHALAYFRHLIRDPGLPAQARTRVEKALSKLRADQAAPEPAPPPDPVRESRKKERKGIWGRIFKGRPFIVSIM